MRTKVRVRAVLAARRNITILVLLVGVAFAGTFAYRAQAQQQPPFKAGFPGDRILVAEPDPPAQQGRAAAPAPPVQPPGPVHVITFVDLTPDNRVNGTVLLKQYAEDTRKDPGVTRVDLLAQTNRPNHLVLDIVYQDQASFDRHVQAQHTKDFMNKMIPIIGAPFDERPHYNVQ